jgi:hypothetical protein
MISTGLIWCVLHLAAAPAIHAQIRAANTVEILLQEEDRPYFLMPCDDAGVLLYRGISTGTSITEKQWEVRLLDQVLHTVWHTVLLTSSAQTIIGGYYDSGFIYFLVLDYEKAAKRYMMLRMDIADRTLDHFELGEYVPETLDFLRVHNGSVLLGGADKSKPSIVCYRYGSRRPVVLQGIYGRNNSILGIDLLPDNGFIVYMGKRTARKSRSVVISQYSAAGELHSQTDLQPSSDRQLLDCRMMTEYNLEKSSLGAGLYSSDNNTAANGIYTVVINRDGAQEFKYYSFENLLNFFEYLTPSDQERRLARIESRRQKGKKDVHKEYVLLRKPFTDGGTPVLVGECYARNNKVYDPYFGWEIGFMFSHAFFIGIKEDGRVAWDNSMVIDTRGEVSELQKTFVHNAGDRFMAFSYSDPVLYYKHIGFSMQSDTLSVGPQRKPIFDSPATYADMVIRKWFGNNYLLFGVRTMDEGSVQERQFTITRLSVAED